MGRKVPYKQEREVYQRIETVIDPLAKGKTMRVGNDM